MIRFHLSKYFNIPKNKYINVQISTQTAYKDYQDFLKEENKFSKLMIQENM